MKIDSDLVTNLVLGQSQKTIERGDSSVTIPPIISANLPTILPVQFADSGTSVMLYSAVVDSEISRTNQAALENTILTLGPGYWDITVWMAAWFNWTHVTGLEDVDVYAELGNRSFTILSGYAASGTQQFQRSLRLLTRNNLVLHHEVGITGVAQTTDTVVFISASKLL